MEICKRCKYESTCSTASESDFCLNYEPRPLTNADRIRAMTDEELAALFYRQRTTDHTCPPGGRNCQHSCEKCWLDWLKQEAITDG